MVELKIYQSSETEMPTVIKQQIVDFLRMQWPEGFQGKNRLRNWITQTEHHPVNFVLMEENIVISHMEVVWKYLEHNGVVYKIYGLTGVLTYPQFRKQGYGKQVLEATTEYIKKSDADIAMYQAGKDLVNFYRKACWEPIYEAKTFKGPKEKPVLDDGVMMALFISEKGKQGRKDFETKPLYFGEDTW